MQRELDEHYPSSDISILAINEYGEESANGLATQDTDLPLLQDRDGNNDQRSDVWTAWDVTWRDVRVVDGDATLRHVVNLTPTTESNNSLSVPSNYEHLMGELVSVARDGIEPGSAWQNPVEPLDVSNDGFVVANDVLRIINRINSEGAGALAAASDSVPNYYDVSGDNHVTSLDALRIIRHINRFSNTPASEPPEQAGAAAEPPEAGAADAFFAMAATDLDDDE